MWRFLDRQIGMEPFVIDRAKEEAKMARIVRDLHVNFQPPDVPNTHYAGWVCLKNRWGGGHPKPPSYRKG